MKRRYKTIKFEDRGAAQVSLAGTFNSWSTTELPLRKNRNGVWTRRLSLTPGRYEYRFVVDGSWTSDPEAEQSVPNPYGDSNLRR